MKSKIFIFLATVLFVGLCLQNCTPELEWSENYDIDFPVPSIDSVSALRVSVDDTLTLMGDFHKVTSVTIGGGFATIDSLTLDSTTMFVIVTETCASGPLVVSNVYEKKGTYKSDLFIEDGQVGPVAPPERIQILDFASGGALPAWTKNTWTEARDLAEQGYDLNDLSMPAGYEHYYSMNDFDLADDANTAYGYFNSDNGGIGFDISVYDDPYVSVLINTGSHAAYLSLSMAPTEHNDFNPSQSPGGVFANGEDEVYFKSDGKWLWYTFSLSDVLGGTVPEVLATPGLFVRAGWAYPADWTYPGFELNIAEMIITDGPMTNAVGLPIMNFANLGPLPTWEPSGWSEAKEFDEEGYDLNPEITAPDGYSHYYAMNDKDLFPPDEPAGQSGNIPYGNYTSDNGGAGFDLTPFTDPYISILMNTGAEDICYLSAVINGGITDFQPEHSPGGTFANGETAHYMQTDGNWLWYTFSLTDIMGGSVPESLESAGLFFRNSWDFGADIYPGFQLNLVSVSITEGPMLNE
jgi:hypothetical protein